MGIDKSQFIAIGYNLTKKDLKSLDASTPTKYRLEKRFNPNTGEEIEPRKVIESYGCEAYELDGKFMDGEYAPPMDTLGEALCEKFGGTWRYFDDSMCGDWENLVIGVTAPTDSVDPRYETNPAEIDLKEVVDAWPKLLELGENLKSLGITIGEPKIVNCWSVS